MTEIWIEIKVPMKSLQPASPAQLFYCHSPGGAGEQPHSAA